MRSMPYARRFTTVSVRMMSLLVGIGLAFNAVMSIVSGTPAASVELVSPNGGELWEIGTQKPVVWNQSGVFGDLRLQYSTDGGSNWKTIVDATEADGSYIWTVPDDRSDDVYVRITSTQNPAVTDQSDAPFTIYKQYTFLDSHVTATPQSLSGGEEVTFTVMLYEESSATLSLTNALPDSLRYVTETLRVEPEWKNPAQYIEGEMRWADTVTRTVPVAIQYRAQVTPTTSTLVIVNSVWVARNTANPVELTATIIANGFSVQLPMVIKGQR
jgi:hypothetical protein